MLFYRAIRFIQFLPPLSPPPQDVADCALLGAIPAVVALVGGLLALCVLRVGLALLGAAAGAGVGYFLYTAALYHIPCTIMLWSGMSLVLAIALGVGALAGLIFMCIFEKSYLILATASAGASAATPLIAILIGHIPAAWATAILADARFKYAKAITQLVLFIIGLIVQCRLTRKRCAYGDKKRI